MWTYFVFASCVSSGDLQDADRILLTGAATLTGNNAALMLALLFREEEEEEDVRMEMLETCVKETRALGIVRGDEFENIISQEKTHSNTGT